MNLFHLLVLKYTLKPRFDKSKMVKILFVALVVSYLKEVLKVSDGKLMSSNIFAI